MKSYNDLIIKYPLLFLDENTTDTFSFECGIGWYDIIEAVCICQYYNYEAAAVSLKYICDILENVDEEFTKRLAYRHKPESKEAFIKEYENKKSEYIGIVEKIKGNLPRFTQIKEKFGALRMYYSGGDNYTDAIVNFAEFLSCSICEKCGLKGSIDKTNAYAVRCESCRLQSTTERNLMNELEEGIDFLANQRVEEVKKELAHIEKPYSLEKILEQYSSGSYNAELLLQHTLLLLSNERISN